MGSVMPEGGGFAYQDGALVSAMENGDWFLSDEFNLVVSHRACASPPPQPTPIFDAQHLFRSPLSIS